MRSRNKTQLWRWEHQGGDSSVKENKTTWNATLQEISQEVNAWMQMGFPNGMKY